ncbi:MAG TPA: OmpA family protein [Planctomycetota bacterium]|nr:OmpA family protein [Planctomycetota bacterium]
MADDAPPPMAPLWIVSFGDMISNMVTFFILLAAFSTPSSADVDVRELAVNVREPGVFDVAKKRAVLKRPASADAKIDVDGAEQPSQREEENLDRKLDAFVMGPEYAVKPDFSRLADGLRIQLEADRAFRPGDAEPSPEAAELIMEIGRFFRGEGCTFTVEAHCDARTHRYSGASTPAELSRDMAVAAARVLHERAEVPAHRVIVAPKGADSPVASDDTPAGRAANRRIAVVVRKAP